MNITKQPVLLSLKPLYADLIFERQKTAELRRRIASYMQNRDVYIYVSSPVMELRGGFRVGEVWRGAPEDVWSMVRKRAAVDKRDFDNYFEGKTVAYALEIKEVWKYPKPVNLDTLRGKFSKFTAPQSWRYVRDYEYQFFQKMKPQTKACLEMRRNASQPLVPSRYAYR